MSEKEGVISGLVVVCLGLLIGSVSNSIELIHIIAAFILVAFSAAIGIFIYRIKANEKIHRTAEQLETEIKKLPEILKNFEVRINTLDNSIASVHSLTEIFLTQFSKSIITEETLISIEGSVNDGKEIWVLTSELLLEGEKLKKTIRENFEREIKYTYLIPAGDSSAYIQTKFKKLAKEWKEYCKSPKNQIKCFLVPKHFAYMTVIVYDPYGESPIVCVKFPKSKIYPEEKYPLIYRVDDEPKDARNIFLEALREMMVDNPKDAPICCNRMELQLDFNNPKT